MKTVRISAFVLGGLLASALVAHAQSFVTSFTGTTTGGPVWNRPLAGSPPAGLSGVGTATPFSVQPFYVVTPGSYTFQETATVPTGWDNFTFLYQTNFDPSQQLVNVLIGNDDNPGIGLSGFTFNLSDNTQYFFVSTGFGNTDSGDFQVDVSNLPGGSQGIVLGFSSVPEPSTMILGGMALVGCAAAVQRRRSVRRKRIAAVAAKK